MLKINLKNKTLLFSLLLQGRDLIHVLDYSDPENIERVDYYQIPVEGKAIDLETCGDLVAVSYDDTNQPLLGKVYIFRTYDGSSLQLLQEIHGEYRHGAPPGEYNGISEVRPLCMIKGTRVNV